MQPSLPMCRKCLLVARITADEFPAYKKHTMRHPMYRKEPSFGETAVLNVERAGQMYAAGKTIYEIGRGLYAAGRIIGPLLL